jgi:hypothetical protein
VIDHDFGKPRSQRRKPRIRRILTNEKIRRPAPQESLSAPPLDSLPWI